MRTIFLILILAVVALIAAFALGLLNLGQTRPAAVPTVSVQGGTVTAQGGQAPKFKLETGSVGVGTAPANVALPTVTVQQKPHQVNVPRVEVRPAQPVTNEAAR